MLQLRKPSVFASWVRTKEGQNASEQRYELTLFHCNLKRAVIAMRNAQYDSPAASVWKGLLTGKNVQEILEQSQS